MGYTCIKHSSEIFLYSVKYFENNFTEEKFIYMANIHKTTKKIAFSILVYLVKGVTLKGSLQSGLSSTAALFSSDQGSLCISND